MAGLFLYSSVQILSQSYAEWKRVSRSRWGRAAARRQKISATPMPTGVAMRMTIIRILTQVMPITEPAIGAQRKAGAASCRPTFLSASCLEFVVNRRHFVFA